MSDILVVNPAIKAKRTKPKKGVYKMAKKKGKKRTYKTKTSKKRSYKRNPSARKLAKRAGASAVRNIGGMNIKTALKNVPAQVIGMMAAKWAAKRFGESSALETDPNSWTAMDYVKGGVGAFGAGFVAQMLRPGMGQRVLEGGLALMGYKLLQNELIPRSEWAVNQFGQDDATETEAAIQYDAQGTPFLLGSNGQWYPVDERHRLPEAAVMGDELTPPGRLGDQLSPPGPLGDSWEDAYFGYAATGRKSDDVFARAFFGN